MRVLSVLVLAFLALAVYAQQCPRCTPLCQNGDGSTKVCGSDGCGGSCGTCPSGQACCRGSCACQPSCAGRECGDDGCGYQSCGSCSSTQTCSNGVCVGTAVAECSGRVCGSNRAGGSCGSCPTGQRCRGGACECYYDCNDRNCGTAPQAAGTNTALCPQRSCGSCPTGFTCNSDTGLCSQLQNCFVSIYVVDCATRQPIVSTASLTITQASYSLTASVAVNSYYNWTTPGTGTFSIAKSASGYISASEEVSITATTTTLTVCLNPATVRIDVRDRATDTSITVSTSVSYSGVASGTFTWNGIYTWTHGGFGSYTFTATPSSVYKVGTTTVNVDASTSLIIIYVDANPIEVQVRLRSTDTVIEVNAAVSFTGLASGSFTWVAGTTNYWTHSGFGSYSFTAVPVSKYGTGTLQVSVSATTTLIIIYVDLACGDGVCSNGETYTNCKVDCLYLLLEMEDADGTGPVTQTTVNYFSSNPRDNNDATGPNRNSVQADKTRQAQTGSNVVADQSYSRNSVIYFEVITTNFISFYWKADTTQPLSIEDGVYKLRVHLSKVLGSTNKNYRFVNTWKPNDVTPTLPAPTDLNLHVFHPRGALDWTSKQLIVDGTEIGNAVADNKQSGGPATMDISPGANQPVGLWNSKPPRDPILAPTQNSRYLIHSGSFVVVYGKTSNANSGKQLGQVLLNEYLVEDTSQQSNFSSDLWYIAIVTVTQPAQNQPTITPQKKLKAATIGANQEMIFDCEIYSYCNQFVVPYSDSTKRSA